VTVQATSASRRRVDREELTRLRRENWRLKEERETSVKSRGLVCEREARDTEAPATLYKRI
jgi:hypothetical protein